MSKQDESAKELETLLRDALNVGLESPRGGTPVLQLKTVPMEVQSVPKGASALAQDSTPQLAPRLAPDSIRPAAAAVPTKTPVQASRRTRTSLIAVGAFGLFALAAAGGAAWLAIGRPVVPVASASPVVSADTVTAGTASSEAALKIGVTSRVADVVAAPPNPTMTASTAATLPPVHDPKAEAPKSDVKLVAPAPVAAPSVLVAKADKIEKAEAKPKPHTAKPIAAPPEKKEPAAPIAPVAKAAPTPAPAPAAPPAGVDALLQQQLKGAIP